MQSIIETLFTEISKTSGLYRLMNCSNSAKYLEKSSRTINRDFLDESLKALYADARAVNFADEIRKMNPKYVGHMRKNTVSSLDLLLDKIAETPSKRACYNIGKGMMGFDVERSWYLNKFNDAFSKRIQDMPRATDDPEMFVKKVFAIYGDFIKYVYKPFTTVYKDCLRNILGTNAKYLEPLIEENFSAESVYFVNGHTVSDLRYLRRMYREKRYRFEGSRIIFEGIGEGMPEIGFGVWELMFFVLFVQKKVMLLTSVFCLVDIDKARRLALQMQQ